MYLWKINSELKDYPETLHHSNSSIPTFDHINWKLEMFSFENISPAFNNLMSKETAYVYFCLGDIDLDLEQVT